MGESYLEIRKELEEAITTIASIEKELGAEEETIQPIQMLVEGLHSPFCLVALGEKGAGKSALLNAFVKHDLCPLDIDSDKIRVYRHGKEESDHLIAEDLEECCRTLPELDQFTLIDTPANLLLGDARLLTRDIFPIADLVLCVFSVNNPWAPSTWEFLRNVKKEWLSKVAFVVQQADEHPDAPSVSRSLAEHAEQCLGITPALFEVSARLAMVDGEEARAKSGVEGLEKFISARNAASQVHVSKARATCQAARGTLIDLAERVRGTLYMANIEGTRIKELNAILEGSKQKAGQEAHKLAQSVAAAFDRSKEKGKQLLKSNLSLVQTLKSAFSSSGPDVPFLGELPSETEDEINRASEAIKKELAEGSQGFLENSTFPSEEEKAAAGAATASYGKELSDKLRAAITRSRSNGLSDILHDLLDGAGESTRVPALATVLALAVSLASGLPINLPFFNRPLIFGITAAVAAIALTITLMIMAQKHGKILAEYETQMNETREMVLNTLEQQLKEAIDGFAKRHVVLMPKDTLSKPAQRTLEPVLPKIQELETSFMEIDSKLRQLLTEIQ